MRIYTYGQGFSSTIYPPPVKKKMSVIWPPLMEGSWPRCPIPCHTRDFRFFGGEGADLTISGVAIKLQVRHACCKTILHSSSEKRLLNKQSTSGRSKVHHQRRRCQHAIYALKLMYETTLSPAVYQVIPHETPKSND